ncbi:presqualene diphosphate synthase HpnD [Crenobacter sp. SG2303]|uniref:Presqualene diphosphate synthase HpnD n=1 Tax=Crenobacter oryzisoli TaxID=3056844 RepID=A0ABT7XRP0_9NEIS|nr:presqualene diphosphate synthase HpnD [Crenobacter sp. SG2303]MDN0076239.1 presqualene diphosphate synthase HpnD [Crenobacter sp. SG2303]
MAQGETRCFVAATKITSQSTPPTGPAVSSGSSFHIALRVLPEQQRLAMSEIYAFCRAVDDIADGTGSRAERLAGLQQWRTDIAACYAGAAPPAQAGLTTQIGGFGLAQEDFIAIIDGMTMDVVADICAPDEATLDLYCDRVASAVGRLAVRVFGLDEVAGPMLAHHLGRALQLTNILRDIDEDAAIGRVYLPAEALHAAGIAPGEPHRIVAHPNLGQACMALLSKAQAHYDQADTVMAGCQPDLVRSPRIMSEVYHGILTRLAARGWGAPRTKVRVPRAQLLWIVLHYTIGRPGWFSRLAARPA